ncbi:TPA: glycosyltransferase family 9 protein [Pasteurella multocida]|uniref:glycosyltransferase family 9 protein n=1 Tax=Pasteurella multocida TaxID=747 RepID=UPI0035F2DE11
MRIKEMLRRARIAFGKFLFDRKQNSSFSKLDRILFLRKDGKVGDYIVSSFVFRELKRNYPDVKIGVICSTDNYYLFKDNIYIDDIYQVKRKSILSYISMGIKLKKEEYDVVIDPTVFIRNRDLLLLYLIEAKRYIGFLKQDYNIFDVSINEKELHFSEVYKASLELLGCKSVNTKYDIPFSPKENRDIVSFLVKHNINRFIAVNFYGASSSRSFSEENIKVYLKFFHNIKNKTFILLASPSTVHQLHNLSSDYSNIFVYEDSKTIFHVIELIRFSEILISPDTSTVHIASGLDKKIIAFYSKDIENYQHWGPNSSNETHIVFYEKTVNEILPKEIKIDWLI